MRKYFAIFQIGIKDAFQYRGQLFYWVALDALFLLIVFFLWKAIFATKSAVGDYTFSGIVTYYVIAFLVEILAAHYTEYNMEDMVRNGKLNKYLVRPMPFFWYRLFNELGWRVSKFIISFPLYFVFFYFFREFLVFPNIQRLIQFGLALAFSSVLYFMVSYLISYTAFWLLKIGAVVNIMRGSLVPLLGGAVIPLDLFPPFARILADFLPFKYLIYFPIKVYLGQVSQIEFWQGILIGSSWILALGFFVWLVWPAALRKYESVGG